jgi:predicted DNA-binding transcriptional regulator AlpA
MEYSVRPDDILGTSEVASVLGVSKQRIHALRKDPRFPTPFKTIAASPLWDKREVDLFLRNWRPWKLEVENTLEGQDIEAE